MNRGPAALTALAAVTTAQLVGGQRRPTPDQPVTQAWYDALRKPSFTPPPIAFALAWTGLSGLLAYSGYRLLTARPCRARTAALGSWSANLAGIATYSWVQFGRKRLDEALVFTVAMVAASSLAARTASRVDARAAIATLPLVGWTAFATLLQEEVWRRNRG